MFVRYCAFPLLLSGAFFVLPCAAEPTSLANSKDTVAIISGQPVHESDLLPLIQAPMRQLQNQEYELKRKALDNLIEQKLFEAAAREKSLPVEQLLEQEVNTKVPEPTEGEVESFYLGLKDKLNRPLAEVKAELQESLKKARLQRAREDYAKRLRDKSEVTVLLMRPKTKVRLRPGPAARQLQRSRHHCGILRLPMPVLRTGRAHAKGPA